MKYLGDRLVEKLSQEALTTRGTGSTLQPKKTPPARPTQSPSVMRNRQTAGPSVSAMMGGSGQSAIPPVPKPPKIG